MKTYRVQVELELAAKNFGSADKKLRTMERKLVQLGAHPVHIHMKGEK